VGSAWWNVVAGVNENLKEEIGWPEFVQQVADVYGRMPESEKAAAAILVGNCGEAGAINLHGQPYGLPVPISGFNSYWQYGYGKMEPKTVILVGFPDTFLSQFEDCAFAGKVTNAYQIANEETANHPNMYVCHTLRQPWPTFWAGFQYFG
jgi:hypothetical protein